MDPRTRNLWLGLGGGLAVGALIPFVAPVVAQVARPVVKALLKQSMLGLDRLRTKIARASETMEDLFAEVRSEVELELARERGVTAGSAAVAAATGAPQVSAPTEAAPATSAQAAVDRLGAAVSTNPKRAKLVS